MTAVPDRLGHHGTRRQGMCRSVATYRQCCQCHPLETIGQVTDLTPPYVPAFMMIIESGVRHMCRRFRRHTMTSNLSST